MSLLQVLVSWSLFVKVSSSFVVNFCILGNMYFRFDEVYCKLKKYIIQYKTIFTRGTHIGNTK